MRSRAGAYAVHARGLTNTAPATAAFLARFEAEVDPDGLLTPDERARRARHALKAILRATPGWVLPTKSRTSLKFCSNLWAVGTGSAQREAIDASVRAI